MPSSQLLIRTNREDFSEKLTQIKDRVPNIRNILSVKPPHNQVSLSCSRVIYLSALLLLSLLPLPSNTVCILFPLKDFWLIQSKVESIKGTLLTKTQSRKTAKDVASCYEHLARYLVLSRFLINLYLLFDHPLSCWSCDPCVITLNELSLSLSSCWIFFH